MFLKPGSAQVPVLSDLPWLPMARKRQSSRPLWLHSCGPLTMLQPPGSSVGTLCPSPCRTVPSPVLSAWSSLPSSSLFITRLLRQWEQPVSGSLSDHRWLLSAQPAQALSPRVLQLWACPRDYIATDGSHTASAAYQVPCALRGCGPGDCEQGQPQLLAVPGTQVDCFVGLDGMGQPRPRALGFFSQRSAWPPLAGPHPRPQVRVKARARPGSPIAPVTGD